MLLLLLLFDGSICSDNDAIIVILLLLLLFEGPKYIDNIAFIVITVGRTNMYC